MQRMLIRTLWRLALLVLPLGAAALLMPSVAAATQPTCGEVVTSNVNLTGDLNCTNSDGLVVGHNGITINLHGFTIAGNDNGYVGIYNGMGYNHVTVKNGTIEDFGEGVFYYGSGGGKLENLVTQFNTTCCGGGVGESGVDFESSTNGVIDHVTSNDNTRGFFLESNSNVSVTKSKGDSNSLMGLADHFSLGTLNGDKFNRNGWWGVFVQNPLRTSTSMYLVENSTANSNGFSGFKIDDNTPTALSQAKVIGNTAKNNGTKHDIYDGWGFFADQQVKSNNTNGANAGNYSGKCFHVKCHSI